MLPQLHCISRYRYFVVFIIVIFTINMVACGGKKSVKSKPGGQPDWVINTPIENGFLYGVGSAEIFGGNQAGATARAKDMARAELIKQIKVNISSEVEQEITEIVKNGVSDLTKKLRKAVKSQVPDFKLSNVKSTDSYQSKTHISVLVQLNVTKELQILQRKMSELDMQIEEFQAKFKKIDGSGMSAIRIVSPVLVLIDQRGDLQSRYNALAQTSVALIPIDIRDFVAKLYARIAQLTVIIEAQGIENSALKTGLISSLSKLGIRISDSGNSDLVVVYKLKINNVLQKGSYYAITNGEIWIKDELGKVVKAFDVKAKGVSSNEIEAQSRSIKKLSSKIGQEIMSALF